MTTEIILHYRPYENDPTQLSKIAEKVIQNVPSRPQSRLIHSLVSIWWVPTSSKTPAISRDAVEDVKRSLILDHFWTRGDIPELWLYSRSVGVSASSERAAVDAVTLTGCAVFLWTAAEAIRARKTAQAEILECLTSQQSVNWEILLLSPKLQDTLKTLNLHSLYRARWQ